MANTRFHIAVIKGDGIGVDVTDATVAVMNAARDRVGGFELELNELLAGAGYFAENGVDNAAPVHPVGVGYIQKIEYGRQQINEPRGYRRGLSGRKSAGRTDR